MVYASGAQNHNICGTHVTKSEFLRSPY